MDEDIISPETIEALNQPHKEEVDEVALSWLIMDMEEGR